MVVLGPSSEFVTPRDKSRSIGAFSRARKHAMPYRPRDFFNATRTIAMLSDA